RWPHEAVDRWSAAGPRHHRATVASAARGRPHGKGAQDGMSRITTLEEFEKAYREGLGVPLHPRPWREVTAEWLRRHSEGAGDYNPLYRDGDYAGGARFHSLVGSPSFLFSINF